MATLRETLAIAQRHYQARRFKAAEHLCRQILEQTPDQPEAHQILAAILAANQALENTIVSYRQQLTQEGKDPVIHNQLGVALRQQGQIEEAIAHYQQALALRPDYPEALNNLANALRGQGHDEEAIAHYRKALTLHPTFVEAHTNLGLALHDQGQFAEALVHQRQAITLQPDWAEAHFNLSLTLLLLGELPAGFQSYEWRWHRENRAPRPFSQPAWDGSALTGRTILLHAEQGLGDTLQFIRYAPLVAQRGGRVIVECQPSLLRLLSTVDGITQLISRDTPLPPFEVHAPLMSLPHLFGTTLGTIPATIPYLTVPPAVAGHPFSVPVKSSDRPLTLGIVWAGNPNNPTDHHRSASLTHFRPLLEHSGIQLYSLQKGERATDLSRHPEFQPVVDLSPLLQEFAVTAAVVQQLDLVITVDTAIAHLAGALGKPVWILLSCVADWRWFMDREDSPWYPTARLFRQTSPGDWSGVIDRVVTALMAMQNNSGESSLEDFSLRADQALAAAVAYARQEAQQGRLEQAEQQCHAILTQSPHSSEALELLGLIYCQTRRFEDAIAPYQTLVTLRPESATVAHNLGVALAELGRWEEAISAYQRSLALEPNNPRTLYNLGNTLRLQGRLAEAIIPYRQAIALNPSYGEAHHNLGVSLQLGGQVEAALEHYEQAQALCPDSPEVHNSLGSAFRSLGRLNEAIQEFQRAIALRPEYPEAHNNLGLTLCDQGQFQAAATSYQRALQLRPTYPEAHFNLGLLLLLLGHLTQGFQEYEWRWRRQDIPPRSLSQPQWDGSLFPGKTLLIHTEQGLGDAIQFVRYVPLVVQRGGRVILECQEALVSLFNTIPGIDQIQVKGNPLPEFDYYIPLLSLPLVLNTTLETIPAPIPYLAPPPSSLSLAPSPLQVGLVWSGNPQNYNDRNRSMALSTLAPLFDLEGITVYSLQKDVKPSDKAYLEQLQAAERIQDLSPQLTDFASTAAAITQLDLVISVDTSVAHLAGALGKPVWVLLCYVPDWRWLWKREDSPWYPTARLFRQTNPGDWNPVIARVLTALSSLQATRAIAYTAPPPLSEQLKQAHGLLKGKQFAEAQQVCWQILSHHPQEARAFTLLGVGAEQQEQWSTAIAHYQRAISLKPDYAAAYNYLGNTLQRQGKFAEAIPYYERAIALQPNYPEAYNNLGAALEDLERDDEAIAAYHTALTLRPNYPDTYYNLGNVYRHQGRLEEAIAAYQHTIQLQPDHLLAYNNAGLTYYDLGQPNQAIDCYQAAIARQPDYADAHLNLALALLFQGELSQGFIEYEWRWRAIGKDCKPLSAFPCPLWDGSDLTGKTILLQAEQGLGDTLQFVRYVGFVKARGGYVVLECQPPLRRLLLSLTGVDECISQGDPLPAFDTFAPLLNLPRLFKTTLDTIPSVVPYLQPPVPPSSLPLPPLSHVCDFKVGLVWAGSPTHQSDRRRSCPFEALLPLFSVPHIAFYSLQVGSRAGDVQPYLDQIAIADLSDRLHDFADTAAVIDQLDLVITVDTSVAHLAGALGKSVWILLSSAPDWRWLAHRSDSPWYPTARLFRQPTRGDWAAVITQVKTALLTLHPSRSSSPPRPLSPSPASLPSSTKAYSIGIGFPLGIDTGWRVYGLNLTLQLLKLPGVDPVPLLPVANPHLLNPLHRHLLAPLLEQQQTLQALLAQHPDKMVNGDMLLLRPLGNHFVTLDETRRITGTHEVGVIFFEDTHLLPQTLDQANRFDRIVAGSSWNASILRSYGLNQVDMVPQGIDPTLFHPAPRSGLFTDRFVIFSGGKLEYRKGQDIVVAAFKAFCDRHPDALLLTSWHNPWVETIAGLEQAGHVLSLPSVNHRGRLNITEWLVKHGIPEAAILDIGLIPNHLVPSILREADVAVFPNRAEGGTNLVAMECLACGLPVILSANTGHLDLLDEAHCYPLRAQHPVRGTSQYQGTEGWGESDVEEVIDQLEMVYSHRDAATRRGNAAAHFMQDWSWEQQTKRLVERLRDLL